MIKQQNMEIESLKQEIQKSKEQPNTQQFN
ncbi:MAG: hypothetical protein WJU30_00109 [Candidatus Phytoplasma pruni]